MVMHCHGHLDGRGKSKIPYSFFHGSSVCTSIRCKQCLFRRIASLAARMADNLTDRIDIHCETQVLQSIAMREA